MQNIKPRNIQLTMKKTLLILMTVFLFFSCTSKERNVCTIKGQVIGYDNCQTLLLFKSHQDPGYLSEEIKLNEDNSFEYTIINPSPERYSLMSKEAFESGYGYPVNFFADNKTVKFKIHSMDRMIENTIIGSKLTTKLLEFEIEEKKWLDTKPYENNQNRDSINKVFFGNKVKFVKENQNIVGYSMLVQLFQAIDYFHFMDKNDLMQIVETFQKKFPDYSYSEFIETVKNLKVGNKCPNFNAPDKLGQMLEFWSIISNNKITLLDLWAPWCGPCIEKGKEMIPVYSKYKDSGLGVIGVVGGIRNNESYEKAIDNQNFPWQNLREINNENHIWEKYNIMNSGGATFLIDNSGIILAVNPTIEETVKILDEKL